MANADPKTAIVMHPVFVPFVIIGMLLLVAFIVFITVDDGDGHGGVPGDGLQLLLAFLAALLLETLQGGYCDSQQLGGDLSMIQTIKNAWKVPELRGKILFTVFALLIFRVGPPGWSRGRETVHADSWSAPPLGVLGHLEQVTDVGDLAPGSLVVGLHGGVADLAQAQGLGGGLMLGQTAVQALDELDVDGFSHCSEQV